MGRLLPRHLDIIFEINAYFLNALRAIGNFDDDFVRRVSIIDETHGRRVRMAWLAVIGSHKVNGVAKIHSDLMTTSHLRRLCQSVPGTLYQRNQRRNSAPLDQHRQPGPDQILGQTSG